MYKFYFLLSSCIFHLNSFSQLTSKSIQVDFESVQQVGLNYLDDSLKSKRATVRVSSQSDKGEQISSTDTIPLANFLQGEFSFKCNFKIITATKGAITIFKNPGGTKSSQAIDVAIDMPDTIIFTGKKWVSIKNGITGDIPAIQINFIKTGEHKIISGFNCEKYVSPTDSADDIIIWATDKLPGLIIPITGLVSFPYAILEAQGSGKNKFHITATSVSGYSFK